MLVIRFFKIGKKNQPFFRIVVTDKKNPPQGGRFLEILGSYNPLTKEKVLKTERIKYWLSVGAQISDSVYNLLIAEKIIEGKKIDVHPVRKSKKEKEAKAKKAVLETEISNGVHKKSKKKKESKASVGDEDKSSSSPELLPGKSSVVDKSRNKE